MSWKEYVRERDLIKKMNEEASAYERTHGRLPPKEQAILDRKTARRWKPDLLILAIFIVSLSGIASILYSASGKWSLVAEGIYDGAEFGVRTFHASHGNTREVVHVLIHFDDGRAINIPWYEDMPFIKGTRIRILEKHGRYRIEQVPRE